MNIILKKIQTPAIYGLCIALIAAACIIAAHSNGLFRFAELAAYDCYLGFQPQIRTMDSRIVLVGISETDIQSLGKWPLPDGIIADLLESILIQKPGVIGLDIYRDIPVPPGSEKLIRIFSDNPPIITIQKLGSSTFNEIPPPYMVKDMEKVGFNDIPLDPEGIVRRGLLFMDDGKNSYTSFALQLALIYLRKEGILPQPDEINPVFFKLGKTTFIPLEANDGGYVDMDAGGYQFLLDFTGSCAPFSSVSLNNILLKKIPPDIFTDKIVIIGSAAPSLKDYFYVPFSSAAKDGKTLAGLEIHASIVSQLLNAALNGRKPMSYISEWHEWVWIMLWSLVGYLFGVLIRSFWQFVFSLVVGSFILSLISWFSFAKGLWIPSVPALAVFLVSAGLMTAYLSYREKVQRGLLMNLFATHVSKDVADAIWEQRDQIIESGKPRSKKLTATVLFTDLKGFSTVSESMDPQTLIEWLNEYMEAMVNVVIAHKGIVNKFIGDAIMAVFGIPFERTTEEGIVQDAVNAVDCALAMGKELDALNRKWIKENRHTVKMRVGIYTGQLIVGSIGSAQRQEYTVIGDTVNIASRLESFDKQYDEENLCRILIGDATWELLQNRYEFKALTYEALKGKTQKVMIYQVLNKKQ